MGRSSAGADGWYDGWGSEPLASPQAGERMAYLSIGSNIDALRNVRRCLALLRALPGVSMAAVSSLYRTRPWGGATEAEFINLAVALVTALSARVLLARTQRIEFALGRERATRYGARTIDIDLLLIGDEIYQTAALCVPHSGLLARDFMLEPLLEIAPDLYHPITGFPLAAKRTEVRYRHIIERLPSLTTPDPVADAGPLGEQDFA